MNITRASSPASPSTAPASDDPRLPPEVMDQIAAHAGPADLTALASTSRHMHGLLAPRVRSARLVATAEDVESKGQFRAALKEARGLPVDLRSAPLAELASRLVDLQPPRMPVPAALQPQSRVFETSPSLVQWRAAVEELPPKKRSPELEATARAMSHATPAMAVETGSNVDLVARLAGLSHHLSRIQLERAAADSLHPDSAGCQARQGGRVDTLGAQHGFVTPAGLQALSLTAIRSDHPASVGSLARQGGNVQALAAQHGIPAANIPDLEEVALESTHPDSVMSRVLDGGDPRELARLHGITTEEGIERLSLAALPRSG